MKLDGQITLLINREETVIEITDILSKVTFAKITLTTGQLASALSRSADTPCKINIYALDKVGKMQETKAERNDLPI